MDGLADRLGPVAAAWRRRLAASRGDFGPISGIATLLQQQHILCVYTLLGGMTSAVVDNGSSVRSAGRPAC